MNKRKLYESIMKNVAIQVKKVLNEGAPIDFKARLAARHANLEDEELPVEELDDLGRYDDYIEDPVPGKFKVVDSYNRNVVGIIAHCAFEDMNDEDADPEEHDIFVPLAEWEEDFSGMSSNEIDDYMDEHYLDVVGDIQDDYSLFAWMPTWNWVMPANIRYPQYVKDRQRRVLPRNRH